MSLHLRIPSKQFDLTQKRADQARLPLREWLRRVVEDACRPPKA